MKTFICALILISNMAFCGEKLNSLLEQLDNEDYDVREMATLRLSTFPAEYARRFIKLSYTSDAEVRHRLQMIAKEIFYNNVMTKDDRYKRVFGSIGFDYIDFAFNEGPADTTVYGAFVKNVYLQECADGILQECDLICEIDGISVAHFRRQHDVQYGLVIPGQEYVLSIRRYADITAIRERGGPTGDDKYEIKKVKIIAGKKKQDQVNKDAWEQLQKLSNEQWEAFCIETRREFKKELGIASDEEDQGDAKK